MNEWTVCTVRDLVVQKIIDPPMDGNHGEIHPKGNDFREKGIPFIMASDFNNGIIDFKKCKRINKEQADKLRKGFSIVGDVLISHKATIGKTAIVTEIDSDYIMLTPQVTYYRVIDKSKLNNSFLKYYFDSSFFQETFQLRAGAGSTRAYIGITEQHNLPIRFPRIDQQHYISKVLSDLDAKIELNNKINAELESMAKLMYDFWFVQFNFPNEDGQPYKSSGGKMVWNEELKREIPKDWEVKELKNIIENIVDYRGKTPNKLGHDWSENKDDIIALSAKHVKNGKLVNLNTANRVNENLYSLWMKSPLKIGDILMTSEAPCGEFFYLIGNTKYCLSQRLFAIRANLEIVHHSYLYYELSSGNGYSQIQGKMSGSTVFGIRQDELRTVKVLVPNMKIQTVFAEKTEKTFLQIRNNEYQNQKLAELRDWLLPMLMNGQVKVS